MSTYGEEEWREIDWAPNYWVSSLGRIQRVRAGGCARVGLILRQTQNARGYLKVNLSTEGLVKTCQVHTLVCNAFHGPRPTAGHQVAHADGNRQNPRADNLRWATPRENQADRIAHGTTCWGERNGSAKYSPEIVYAVRSANGTNREIGRRFGISKAYVGLIRAGKRWIHLSEDSPL